MASPKVCVCMCVLERGGGGEKPFIWRVLIICSPPVLPDHLPGSQAQLTSLPGLFPQQLVLLLETAFLASLYLCPPTARSCTSFVHFAAISPDTAVSFLSLWVASADNEPAADVEHSLLKVRGELGKHRQNQANLTFLNGFGYTELNGQLYETRIRYIHW